MWIPSASIDGQYQLQMINSSILTNLKSEERSQTEVKSLIMVANFIHRYLIKSETLKITNLFSHTYETPETLTMIDGILYEE
jgi:hypothetical protein